MARASVAGLHNYLEVLQYAIRSWSRLACKLAWAHARTCPRRSNRKISTSLRTR